MTEIHVWHQACGNWHVINDVQTVTCRQTKEVFMRGVPDSDNEVWIGRRLTEREHFRAKEVALERSNKPA